METWKCRWCRKQLSVKNKFTKSGHLAGCVKFQEWKVKTITKEYLEDRYIKRGWSIPDIQGELGLESATVIWKRLKEVGIDCRSISTARKMDKAKRKQYETSM